MVAKNITRTESLPRSDGRTFKVGDGVHWGFNGDSYPGTVRFISDSGRKVYVSRDRYKVIDNQGAFVEGARECEFTSVETPIEECAEWVLRKDGRFTDSPGKTSRSLGVGRFYSSNPHY